MRAPDTPATAINASTTRGATSNASPVPVNAGASPLDAKTGHATRYSAQSASAHTAARPGQPARVAPGLEVMRPECGQARKPEAGEKDQPVVQGEREPGQPRGQVHDSRKARAVRQAGQREAGEHPAAAGDRARGEGEDRERKEHGARVSDRHSGPVFALRLDPALSVDSVGERQRVGQQSRRRRADRDRLPARILAESRDGARGTRPSAGSPRAAGRAAVRTAAARARRRRGPSRPRAAAAAARRPQAPRESRRRPPQPSGRRTPGGRRRTRGRAPRP